MLLALDPIDSLIWLSISRLALCTDSRYVGHDSKE